MEYLYRGLRQSIYDHEPLRKLLQQELGIPDIEWVQVERQALDARRKGRPTFVYHLRFTVRAPSQRLAALLAAGRVEPYRPQTLPPATPRLRLPLQPMIVGLGPAGLFCGLWLARMGYRPILLERGKSIPQRIGDVERLWQDGELNPESNLQFGEGGAGTFSDGKLTTGKRSPLDRLILETLVAAGAPSEILYSYRPHIGTDRLRTVVRRLRREIEQLGGEVHLGQRLEEIDVTEGRLRAIVVSGQRIATSCLILAIGHSARDTLNMLHRRGVEMIPKPFAVGLRIEHPASFINEAQYGAKAARILPAADYRLTYHHAGRGVYSFCMCPGGHVVCAASEPEGLVTNGMSTYARDSAFSNSAIVVSIAPHDYGARSALDAVAFQREIERRAYAAGGGRFIAPAQRALDFVRRCPSSRLPKASFRPGIRPAMLEDLFPIPAISQALVKALAYFDRRIPGFIDQGVLIGAETRTSSPVRILRDENWQSVSVEGLYLLGEGAGYAGGIMTCARDGVRFARIVYPRE